MAIPCIITSYFSVIHTTVVGSIYILRSCEIYFTIKFWLRYLYNMHRGANHKGCIHF